MRSCTHYVGILDTKRGTMIGLIFLGCIIPSPYMNRPPPPPYIKYFNYLVYFEILGVFNIREVNIRGRGL